VNRHERRAAEAQGAPVSVAATVVQSFEMIISNINGKPAVALVLNGQAFAMGPDDAINVGQALVRNGALAALTVEQLDVLRKNISPLHLTNSPLVLG
jgi:hypothetical protein